LLFSCIGKFSFFRRRISIFSSNRADGYKKSKRPRLDVRTGISLAGIFDEAGQFAAVSGWGLGNGSLLSRRGWPLGKLPGTPGMLPEELSMFPEASVRFPEGLGKHPEASVLDPGLPGMVPEGSGMLG
jgi:hypothetical protein